MARRFVVHAAFAAGVLCVAQSPLDGQGAGAAPVREVYGRLRRAVDGAQVPLPGAWVTLHRVAPDAAAPLDSVRTGAGGAFRFRYQPTGDSTAVYFVSSEHAGIAYFSQPLRNPEVRGGDADLVVFDTTSRRQPITIESRHLIVSAPNSGRRTIIEVFVLTNAGSLTQVAGHDTGATFTATLPASASDPKAAEGDVTPEGITFAGGRVRVTAPIAPGSKRVAYSYSLPAATSPVPVSRADSSSLLEVLVEDSAASVTGGGVHEDVPTTISGRTFRRFANLSRGSAADLAIRTPSGLGPRPVGFAAAVAIAVGVVLAGALVVALRRDAAVEARAEDADPLAASDSTA